MPQEHQQYLQWNAERFVRWAQHVGPSTEVVVGSILHTHKVEQQGYRACMALLKLADKYSLKRLETACAKALSYTPHPSYKNISTILQSGQDRIKEAAPEASKPKNTENYGFTRGAAYYGGLPNAE